MPRPVFVASDHAGFELKSVLMKRLPAAALAWNSMGSKETQAAHLDSSGFDWIDLGPDRAEERVDYPDFAKLVCERLIEKPEWQHLPTGILICGSGQGMAMAANRFAKIRAALCLSPEFAVLAREHNNANVLCLAGRFTAPDVAVEICHKFFSTAFLGGRHQARVQKLG